jgi:hypothetical protein
MPWRRYAGAGFSRYQEWLRIGRLDPRSAGSGYGMLCCYCAQRLNYDRFRMVLRGSASRPPSLRAFETLRKHSTWRLCWSPPTTRSLVHPVCHCSPRVVWNRCLLPSANMVTYGGACVRHRFGWCGRPQLEKARLITQPACLKDGDIGTTAFSSSTLKKHIGI